MSIRLYLDGASLFDMARLADQVDGFTTNPSLMKSAGITDYPAFAREVLELANGKPVSFEVLADDYVDIRRQAGQIAAWGENVYVKVPVVNSHGTPNVPLVGLLADEGIKINVTAVFTRQQAFDAIHALAGRDGIVSVFAGRVADTGVDPVTAVVHPAAMLKHGKTQLLWASAREALNVRQAEDAGADIITLAPALLEKVNTLRGMDLTAYAIETARQFAEDAKGLTL